MTAAAAAPAAKPDLLQRVMAQDTPLIVCFVDLGNWEILGPPATPWVSKPWVTTISG